MLIRLNCSSPTLEFESESALLLSLDRAVTSPLSGCSSIFAGRVGSTFCFAAPFWLKGRGRPSGFFKMRRSPEYSSSRSCRIIGWDRRGVYLVFGLEVLRCELERVSGLRLQHSEGEVVYHLLEARGNGEHVVVFAAHCVACWVIRKVVGG